MLLKPDSEITLTGGDWLPRYQFRLVHSQNIDQVNGASSRFYDLFDTTNNSFNNPEIGFEIQYVLDSGVVKNRLIGKSYDNNGPNYLSVNNEIATDGQTQYFVEVGDVIRGFDFLNNASAKFRFTCFDEMLYRSDGNDNEASIEFDVASNSIKYVVGGAFESAINSGSTQGITIRRESFGGLVSLYWRSHMQGSQTIGYVTRDGYTGTWSIHHPSAAVYPYMLAGVVVGTAAEEAAANPPPDDPPENDPPNTPVFVPRSSRRGNLNFW